MATSNFHNVNANKIFAFTAEDVWEYESILECAIERLQGSKYEFTDYGKDRHELRSYPSRVLGSLTACKQYNGLQVLIYLTAIVRSGYYEGANLDWQLTYEIEGYDLEEIDFKEVIMWGGGKTEKQAEHYAKLAEKWARETTDKMVAEMEKIFAKITTPLKVAARFSNGETIYAEA